MFRRASFFLVVVCVLLLSYSLGAAPSNVAHQLEDNKEKRMLAGTGTTSSPTHVPLNKRMIYHNTGFLLKKYHAGPACTGDIVKRRSLSLKQCHRVTNKGQLKMHKNERYFRYAVKLSPVNTKCVDVLQVWYKDASCSMHAHHNHSHSSMLLQLNDGCQQDNADGTRTSIMYLYQAAQASASPAPTPVGASAYPTPISTPAPSSNTSFNATTPTIPASASTFAYTGTDQPYIVPDGVNFVQVKLWGGGGGGSTGTFMNAVVAFGGGAGGFTQCYLSVTPGQQLNVSTIFFCCA